MMKFLVVIGATLLACLAYVDAQQGTVVIQRDQLSSLGVTDLGDSRTPTTRIINGRRFAVVPVTGQGAPRRRTQTVVQTVPVARSAGIPAPLRVEAVEDLGPPIPYAFNFAAEGEDGGSHSRNEERDASGVVTGSYTVNDPDGRTRTVRYVADENGFRAEVETNEIGTETHAPAGINFQSSAPTAAELVAEFEATRVRSPPATTRVVTRRVAAQPATGARVIVIGNDNLQSAGSNNVVRLVKSSKK